MRFVRWSLAAAPAVSLAVGVTRGAAGAWQGAAPAASPSAGREQGRAQRVALVRLAGTRAEVYRHHLGASPALGGHARRPPLDD